MIQLTGIRLTDVRAFAGENFVPVAPGLTVLMGRNNAGKSTVLRAPFLFFPGQKTKPGDAYRRSGSPMTEVSFQLAMTPEDFKAYVPFAVNRIHDVRFDIVGGGSVVLANTDAFASWPAQPLIEVGWRIGPGGERKRFLRFVSAQVPQAYVDAFDTADPGVRGHLPDVNHQHIFLDVQWFGQGFNLFTQPGSPVSTNALQPWLFAYWEHDRVEQVSGWLEQYQRRLVDTGETRLQDTLVFLRMKHPSEFDLISEALSRALPEFHRLDFIDVKETGAEYRPAFVARGKTDVPLARESIGSGAWTFLCILTAARAAKATGARVLMLDEPHLYLHPGLERHLLDELLNPKHWPGGSLQVIASTHSPAFVDAAVDCGQLVVLDWKDQARTSVGVRAVPSDETAALFDSLTSRPSDLLYSERLVFVEGPSDIVALRRLARERCGVKRPLRFVPLCESDKKASEVARYFSVFVQGQGLGFRTQGVLVLDGDKKQKLKTAWGKLPGNLDPEKHQALSVVWAGEDRENDIESVFCDVDFLLLYFKELGIDEATSRPEIDAALANVKHGAQHTKEKGCVAIATLHEKLAGGAGVRKANDLEQLMQFYIANADAPACAAPKRRLAAIEAALRKLGEA